MKRERIAQQFTSILFILLASGYLAASTGYPPGARLIPMVVAFATIAVAGFQLLASFFSSRTPLAGRQEAEEEPAAEAFFDERGQLRRAMVMIAWTLILYALIFTVGFVVAVPLFMVVFLALVDRGSWKLTLSMGAVLGGLSYLLMVGLLELAWDEGVVWSMIR